MGRWTQYDDESSRAPAGMERIGYDSDTHRYHFRDTSDGTVYEGGEYGGDLRIISRPGQSGPQNNEPIRVMPNAPIPTPGKTYGSPSSPSSFSDFLPANKIASASSSPVTSSPRKSPLKTAFVPSPSSQPPGPSRSSSLLSRAQSTPSGAPQTKSAWNIVRSATVPSKMRGLVKRMTQRSSNKSTHAKEGSYATIDDSYPPSRQPSAASRRPASPLSSGHR